MALDPTTEVISHFFGLFDIAVEQARLRDAYEEFSRDRALAELEGLEDPGQVEPNADYNLIPGKYMPIKYGFPVPGGEGPQAPGYSVPPGQIAAPLFPAEDEAPEADYEPVTEAKFNTGPNIIYIFSSFVPDLEYPDPHGSVITVTSQDIALSDSDTFGIGVFRDSAALEQLALVAEATISPLHVLGGAPLSLAEIPTLETAMELAEAMSAFSVVDVPEGAQVTLLKGDAVLGLTVNGEAADIAPLWSDLLPLYHQPEEEPEEGSAEALDPREDAFEGAEFAGVLGKNPDYADGHQVITGGNLIINQAMVGVAWLDAPMIALGGAKVSLDVISQVAYVSNNDVTSAPSLQMPATVVQTAEVTEESREATWLQYNVDIGGDGPSHVHIDEITGDFVIANYIEQTTIAYDVDHISTEFTGATSYFMLGGNELVNVTNLFELGNYYDVILVGGDMISLNMIYQTQVLLDDDWISLPPGADAHQGGTDTASRIDDGSGTATPGVAVAGLDAPDPITGGPDDDLDSDLDEDQPTADPSPDNLLMNAASISKSGIDTMAGMTASLAEMIEMAKSGAEGLTEALLNDPLFAGMEQLRVLSISGDLVTVNSVNQTTVLADQDDIQFGADMPAGTEIIAGSNALLNSASIVEQGVDSTVYSNQEAYSDLLLLQAHLVDEPEFSEMEQAGELVSEAVAFLIDDALDEMDSALDRMDMPATMDTAADGMASVLA